MESCEKHEEDEAAVAVNETTNPYETDFAS
jgi:hypothetical protein